VLTVRPTGGTATGFGIVDRKNQTSSGSGPGKLRGQAETSEVDDAWDNLSDADLIELDDDGPRRLEQEEPDREEQGEFEVRLDDPFDHNHLTHSAGRGAARGAGNDPFHVALEGDDPDHALDDGGPTPGFDHDGLALGPGAQAQREPSELEMSLFDGTEIDRGEEDDGSVALHAFSADDEPGELAPVRAADPRRHVLPDLPAPVGPSPSRAVDDASRATLTDLPAPVGPVPRRNLPDLPAPVGPRPTRPTPPTTKTRPITQQVPMAPPPARSAASILPERPAPGSVSPPIAQTGPIAPIALPDDIDLPVPVGPLPTRQLPDLLTPVGPTPVRSAPELPAPKGFFDDGVQPKIGPGSELPAPKGFFDDGVQPRLGTASPEVGAEPIDLDFPLELGASPSLAAARLDALGTASATPPPFELGEPVGAGGVNRPFGLDAADLDLERAGDVTPPPLPLELSDAPLSGNVPRSRTSRLELGLGFGTDLDAPGAPPSSTPSAVIDLGKASPAVGMPLPDADKLGGDEDRFAPTRSAGHLMTTEIRLELDKSPMPGAPPLPTGVVKRPAAPARAEVAPRKRTPPRAAVAARRRLALLLGTLVTAALMAGGYTAWKWWQGGQTRDARAAGELREVEKLLADDAPTHWEKAAGEARRLAGAEGASPEATAIVAEASFAAALDESPQRPERIKEGDQALGALRTKSARGPHAAKAEALRAILSTNMDDAVKKLEDLLRTARGDRDAQLYLGWALAAQEQHGKAIAAYKAALGQGKPRIAALYGLALSQIELGEKQEATRSLQTVIQLSRDRYRRDHLGALIGLAQLAPISERDSRYQELLARPDLATAPPRAVSRLRALAGDEALRGGRFDQARARYDAARTLDPLNLRATVGVALLAARAGDLAGARKKLKEDVLAAAPGHIEGALALIDVTMAQQQRDEAGALVDALFARKPPIANTVLLGRAHLARARVFEASPDPTVQARAEAEYREAMQRAEPGDFAATVGLSSLLLRLGRKQEAVDVLAPIKAAASQDTALALTLGHAYLAAGQAEAAAETFRGVLERAPDNAEARFQLGNAHRALGRFGDAIDSLRRAAEVDPSREDIGLALARTLESAGRGGEAIAAYQKMLAGDRKPSVAVRGQAGRAFARMGMAAEAAAQGDAIRAEDPRDAAGQFLLGETLFNQGKYEDALKAYREAARLDSEAQYFEALGRTGEKMGKHDEALRSYGDAIAADARYLAPRLGRGRVRLQRREYTQAVGELEAALKVAPDSAEVLRDLGRSHLAMLATDRAVPLLERAASLDSRDPLTHYELGRAYFELERAGAAAGHLARAVELVPESAPWRGEAFRLLGFAQRAAGNHSGAISAFRRYLAIERTDGPERRDAERMLMRLEAR
jgi:tetratricopeptide (TPR) repeat protein